MIDAKPQAETIRRRQRQARNTGNAAMQHDDPFASSDDHSAFIKPAVTRRDALAKLTAAAVAAPLGMAALRSADAAALLFSAGELQGKIARLNAAGLPDGLAEAVYFRLTPGDMPWTIKPFGVAAGQKVTVLLSGRWHISRDHDVWLEPGVVFHARIGGSGGNSPVYNPMNNTGTMTADRDGRLEIARSAGEWANDQGVLATPPEIYQQADGVIEGVALRWTGDPLAGLRKLAATDGFGGLAEREIARLQAAPATPAGWRQYHQFGEAGVFALTGAGIGGGPAEMCCETHKNVSLLQKNVDVPLEPGLRLNWRWIVDELPSLSPEDQAATHDYLSIAAEFDDGQDITYMWSVGLPPGKAFRCPLPYWNDIETHVVARSGRDQLGTWLNESRPLTDDYRAHIGGKATRVVRVWLIAVSLFMRRTGSCRYADIALAGPSGAHRLL